MRIVTAACSRSCSAASVAEVLGGEERRGGVEDEDVPVEAFERGPRGGDGVARAERLLLDRDLDALVGVCRVRRGDDDDPLGAGTAGRIDHPVDHAPAEQRVEVLRHARAHARPEPSGHHDCCEIARSSPSDGLGRQDSNLGSRDQNPLPYHLATPHRPT